MISITINGIDYKLPLEKLQVLMTWLQNNGATKVMETSSIDNDGRTLINE